MREISFSGGGVAVLVGGGATVPVGSGLVLGGGAVPVGRGPVVPVGTGFGVPVGTGFGVLVGSGFAVPPGGGFVPIAGGAPGPDAQVVEHVVMSCVAQKQASMQVPQVPHAGALEQPAVTPGVTPGVVAPAFDFPESELELQASAAMSDSALNPTMLGFI